MHFNIASDDFSFTRLKEMAQYFLLPSILLTGCTTTQEIKRPDGVREYLIACGASLSWSVCYSEANNEAAKDEAAKDTHFQWIKLSKTHSQN